MAALIDWLLGRDINIEERDLAEMQIATASQFPFVAITDDVGGGGDYSRSLPAVYRARLMTINTVGQLPIQAAQDQAPIVRRPDPSITRQEWVRQTVASLVDNGNAYWRLIPAYARPSVSAVVADPVDISVTWNGTRTARLYTWRGVPMVHGRDIVHIAMARGPGQLYGRGPMQHRRLAGVAAALSYSENYFLYNGDPGGTLEVPYEVDAVEAQALIDQWVEKHPPGSRNIGLLSGGLTFKTGGLSPKDADWVGTHGAGILDVAQIFGMQARLLGYSQPGSSLTYGNVSDIYLSWWREALQPDYVAPIEQAWSEIAEQEIFFDPIRLIRGDLKSRYDAYAVGVNAGVLMPNEARALEGLDPLAEQAPAGQEVAPSG